MYPAGEGGVHCCQKAMTLNGKYASVAAFRETPAAALSAPNWGVLRAPMPDGAAPNGNLDVLLHPDCHPHTHTHRERET